METIIFGKTITSEDESCRKVLKAVSDDYVAYSDEYGLFIAEWADYTSIMGRLRPYINKISIIDREICLNTEKTIEWRSKYPHLWIRSV